MLYAPAGTGKAALLLGRVSRQPVVGNSHASAVAAARAASGEERRSAQALAIAALVTPMAPTRMRLSAQTASRLNQAFEMNLNPSH